MMRGGFFMSHDEVRQEWEVRIAAYRSSGQSATDWCASHQLQPRQLWYWIRKFKTPKASVTPPSRWMAVNVEHSFKEKESALRVRIGSVVIEVHQSFNPALFSEVVRTLQTLC
jgi:hypothetical protein